jgi:mannose-1-phosphate guanylyltransferase/mannose-6-phosphate isomerase
LALHGEQSMLQQTVGRLEGASGLADNVIVICNEEQRFLVAQQLQEIGAKATIMLEPAGRNTAPAIALAALHALDGAASAADAPALMIMPSDHVIANRDAFVEAIGVAGEAAGRGALVTFGIVPAYPHTGYGYIETDQPGPDVMPVLSFTEKPDPKTAESYVGGGRHYWNSGMFLFRADSYLEELEKFAPGMVSACKAAMASAAIDCDFIRPHVDHFLACPAESVDYAVMEKTDKAMMVPLDAGWNDVGSWSALHDISLKDGDGNALSGDVAVYECSNCFLSGESRLLAAVGLENVVVVETKDAILVADKAQSERVKELVDQLKEAGREEVSLHRQVYRPWGSYDSLENMEGFQVKRLIVNPGAILSLQMHHHRAEHWVVVQGTATITLNEDEFELGVNESTYVPIGAKHRIANMGSEPVHIIEVQCGEYLGEDDIVRFEDKYGREGTNT